MRELHYTLSGTGNTLVFVHGAYVDSTMWQPQVREFERSYQVLNVDLRGHGRSSEPSEMSEYSVDVFSNDLIALMDKLGIASATFVGLSLGAMVAQHLAVTHPHRVEGIVLTGAPASMKLTPVEWFMTTLVFPKWFALYLLNNMSLGRFMKLSFLMTWFIRGSKWLGKNTTREAIKECMMRVPEKELSKIYAAVHGFRKQPLGRGNFPVLLINGQFDSPVIHYHSRYIKRKVGAHRGTVVILKGAGHACNFDDPQAFNRSLGQWLEAHSAAPAPAEKRVKEPALVTAVVLLFALVGMGCSKCYECRAQTDFGETSREVCGQKKYTAPYIRTLETDSLNPWTCEKI